MITMLSMYSGIPSFGITKWSFRSLPASWACLAAWMSLPTQPMEMQMSPAASAFR